MRPIDFFNHCLKNGRIEGAFTTSKNYRDLLDKYRISFVVHLIQDQASIFLRVSKFRRRFGFGFVRNQLIRQSMTFPRIMRLRWIPAGYPTYEGFVITLQFTSEHSGVFKLELGNPDRFDIWKNLLE